MTVVETKNQGCDGGFTAAGAADDRGCLAAAAAEVQVRQGVFLCVGKSERDVAEGKNLILVWQGFLVVLLDQVANFRRMFEHRTDTLTALQRTGHGQNDHLGHH